MTERGGEGGFKINKMKNNNSAVNSSILACVAKDRKLFFHALATPVCVENCARLLFEAVFSAFSLLTNQTGAFVSNEN